MIVHLAKRTTSRLVVDHVKRRCSDIMTDLIASIPYHLSLDIRNIAESQTGAPLTINRPASGLLLLHPLYARAKREIVPWNIRLYLTRYIAWIAEHMGIGQAALLAKCVNGRMDEIHPLSDLEFPFQIISEGQILIWARMLIQPTCLIQSPCTAFPEL